MNNSKEITRILFENFHPQAIHLFYAFGYAAIAVFTYGTYVQIRKYRRGKPDGSWGELLHRFIEMVKTMTTHRTLVRRDKSAGRAVVHWYFYYYFRVRHLGAIIWRTFLVR